MSGHMDAFCGIPFEFTYASATLVREYSMVTSYLPFPDNPDGVSGRYPDTPALPANPRTPTFTASRMSSLRCSPNLPTKLLCRFSVNTTI